MLVAHNPPSLLVAKLGRPSAYVNYNVSMFGETFVAQMRPGSRSFLVSGNEPIRQLSTRPFSDRWSERAIRQRQIDELGASSTMSVATGLSHLAHRNALRSSYRPSNTMLSNIPIADAVSQGLSGGPRSTQQVLEEIAARAIGFIFTGENLGPVALALVNFISTLTKATLLTKHDSHGLSGREYNDAKTLVFDWVKGRCASGTNGNSTQHPFWKQLKKARTDGVIASDKDMYAAALMPFIAGVGQVATTTAFTLTGLLSNPKDAELTLQEWSPDRDDVDMCISPTLRSHMQESMRLFPTAPIIQIAVETEFVLAGELMGAGSTLLVAMTASYHLDRLYPQPLVYMPMRWRQDTRDGTKCLSMSFGMTPHRCMSENLAKWLVANLSACLLRRRAAFLEANSPMNAFELTDDLFPARLKLRSNARHVCDE